MFNNNNVNSMVNNSASDPFKILNNVNVKGVGKRKVRYYKNGNVYVVVKGKKKRI